MLSIVTFRSGSSPVATRRRADLLRSGLALGRRIGCNTTFQRLGGLVLRGRAFPLRFGTRMSRQYLNAGCGAFAHPGFLNLDHWWHLGVDLCWDLTKPLPLPDDSLRGIFTEHCLEHLPFGDCRRALVEMYRVLRPAGVLRIVVPDAGLYLDLYQKAMAGDKVTFPYPEPGYTPMMYVNRTFRGFGHQFAYDFETLRQLLLEAGFSEVGREQFGRGRDPRLLIDAPRRSVESLYIEAVKGGRGEL